MAAKNDSTVVVMSEDMNESTIRACSGLFALVKAQEGSVFPKKSFELPGSFAECAPYQVREVIARAYQALKHFDEAAQAVAMKGAKERINSILDRVKVENLEAQAIVMALPEAARKWVPAKALRDWVGIPVSDLLECFPEGTTIPAAVTYLHDLGITMVQGKSEKDEDGTDLGPRVRVQLRETVKLTPPVRPAKDLG